MKKIFRVLLATALLASFVIPTLADTIKLKDGSVIRGQVIGFKDQQFTILIGGNAKGRRGQTTVYVEDVESIEFDAIPGSGTEDTSAQNNGPSTCRNQPARRPTLNLTRLCRTRGQTILSLPAPPRQVLHDQGECKG